jgi:hypothetical protein
MNVRRPNPNCPMACTFRNRPQCVCNLISVSGRHSSISHGLRIGLGHFYGTRSLPPCVRGSVGAAYWSTDDESVKAAQPGMHAAFAQAEK